MLGTSALYASANNACAADEQNAIDISEQIDRFRVATHSHHDIGSVLAGLMLNLTQRLTSLQLSAP